MRFHLYEKPRVKFRDRKKNGSFQGLEEGKNRKLLLNGYGVSIWKNEKVLKMNGGDVCPTM